MKLLCTVCRNFEERVVKLTPDTSSCEACWPDAGVRLLKLALNWDPSVKFSLHDPGTFFDRLYEQQLDRPDIDARWQVLIQDQEEEGEEWKQ